MNHSQSWPTILSKGNSCSMILKELIPHWFQRMLAALNAKNTNLNHTTENYCARLQFNLACGWYGSRNLGMFLPSSDFPGHIFSLGPSSWLCHSALTTLGAHRSHIWHRGDLPQLGSSQRAVNLNISLTVDCQTPTGSTGWAATLPGLRKGRSPVQEHRVTLRCCRGFTCTPRISTGLLSLSTEQCQVILGPVWLTQMCFDKTWDLISSYFNNLSKTQVEFLPAFFSYFSWKIISPKHPYFIFLETEGLDAT